MKTLLNIIWLCLSGFWMFLVYSLIGLIWCCTVVGIPFGVASFRIGMFALWPFGREVVRKESAGAGSALGNALWFVLSGIWIALGHVLCGVILCCTLIGIPLGVANFKMIQVCLFPLGREIVSSADVRDAMSAARAAKATLPVQPV